MSFSYNAAGASGHVQLRRGLADGDYRSQLNGPASPTWPAIAMTSVTSDFFFLNGDANHDRAVNLLDFNILAVNFGLTGRDFTQGDFNYDGTVNLSDFNLLSVRFGTGLAPGTFASATPISRAIDSDADELLTSAV
jgi:hypothetical protein